MAPSTQRPMPFRSGAGVMGSVYLSDYIRECLPYAADEEDLKGVFCNSTGTATKPPILRRGVPNTIIVFPGYFNPPSINHARLLRHVVRNAGQDLNIIAAVVCLIDQDKVDEFMKRLNESWYVFSSADERRDVWVGAGIPVDWVWIHTEEQCSWNALSALMKLRAAQDGFDLRFLMLCGPEYFPCEGLVWPEGPVNPAKWGCSNWITSDVGKPGDFVFPSLSEPITEPLDCNRWRRVITKAKDIHAIAISKFVVHGSEDLVGVTKEQVREEMRRIVATTAREWTCTRSAYPWGRVRFVASPLAHRRLEANTEDIRYMIYPVKPQDLAKTESELASIALNVRCLLTYAVDWKDDDFGWEVGWDEWNERMEKILAAAVAKGREEKGDAAGASKPDEEALHKADMYPRNPGATLQRMNEETPFSAVRSTIFTHADEATSYTALAPRPRGIWGPNTYLNEDEPEEDGAAVAEWTPTYPYALPKV